MLSKLVQFLSFSTISGQSKTQCIRYHLLCSPRHLTYIQKRNRKPHTCVNLLLALSNTLHTRNFVLCPVSRRQDIRNVKIANNAGGMSGVFGDAKLLIMELKPQLGRSIVTIGFEFEPKVPYGRAAFPCISHPKRALVHCYKAS